MSGWTPKVAMRFVWLLLGIPLVYAAILVALMVRGTERDDFNRFVSVSESFFTLFLTALLALMAVFTAAMNERVADASRQVAEIAAEQHAKNKAEFLLRDVQSAESATSFPGITHPGDFRFTVINRGWKDGAVERAWIEALATEGRLEIKNVQLRERDRNVHSSDFMVRAGDRRVFLGQAEGYLGQLDQYRQITLFVKPVVGEPATAIWGLR